MFDVGFSELLVIGVVALLVLGPEKLPSAVRTAAALLRRLKQNWQAVRSDLERELASEELKSTGKWLQDTARQAALPDAADTVERAHQPASEPGPRPVDTTERPPSGP